MERSRPDSGARFRRGRRRHLGSLIGIALAASAWLAPTRFTQSQPSSTNVPAPALDRNSDHEIMTDPNSFTNARVGFGGLVSGADEKPHDLFKIEREDSPVLFGDYILAFLEDGNHFNVEIGPFGYVDPYYAGDLNPSRRRHFSAEECSAAEQLISIFFSGPGVFDKRFLPREDFLGGIRFRPNWIIQETDR